MRCLGLDWYQGEVEYSQTDRIDAGTQWLRPSSCNYLIEPTKADCRSRNDETLSLEQIAKRSTIPTLPFVQSQGS